ncbi:hypothetical protein FH608_013460 [Nonomuraea phyllanthi]|uniref:Uncharacterized protein n=1 Tax=Nonomuraea phyllanthi TaxID=2219224 RepID=A0A5C4WNV4_9ACTN|nr:hypothetical protein [Nonomuraea phyllanthi]KAB8195354.1 hypothetical protein FH608_013460 [Nonomuraea phyllanthi]
MRRPGPFGFLLEGQENRSVWGWDERTGSRWAQLWRDWRLVGLAALTFRLPARRWTGGIVGRGGGRASALGVLSAGGMFELAPVGRQVGAAPAFVMDGGRLLLGELVVVAGAGGPVGGPMGGVVDVPARAARWTVSRSRSRSWCRRRTIGHAVRGGAAAAACRAAAFTRRRAGMAGCRSSRTPAPW